MRLNFGLSRIETLLLLGFLLAGIGVRAIDLADKPLEVDEAESTINALTILEHGYPTSHYMGLPIYENTLTEPWPDSEEYEFRDSSYTADGVAIYHAWLPLYSIAAVMKLAGVEADPATNSLRPRYGKDDLARRTLLPRIPSLAFAGVFLLAMFGLGRAAAGAMGGWTALALAAFTEVAVNLGSPARYYSATMALSALAGLTLWHLLQRGARRHYLRHGLVMALLFHTHVLSCLVLGLVSLTTLPRLIRQHGFLKHAALCGGIFAVGVVPWILLTGFPGDAAAIPKAWHALDGPLDFLKTSGQRPLQWLAMLAALGWLGVALIFCKQLPSRWTEHILAHRRTLLFFTAWTGIAFLAFSFLIPLISYFPARMSMMLVVPKLMFIAIVLSAAVQTCLKVKRSWSGAFAAVLLLVGSGRAASLLKEHEITQSALPPLIDYFESREFGPDARLYVEPSYQLVLQYMLGMPAQSIAPVRKSFLDQHEGEVVFLTFPEFALHWDAEKVAELAPDADDAAAIAEAVRVQPAEARVAELGARLLNPTQISIPAAVAAERQAEREAGPGSGWWSHPPVFRGFPIRRHADAWKVFFYRFASPETRMGPLANYADRVRGSEAELLSAAAAVIYRSDYSAAR